MFWFSQSIEKSLGNIFIACILITRIVELREICIFALLLLTIEQTENDKWQPAN